MLNIGPGEILIIVAIILVLAALGKLPSAAKQAGKAYKTVRKVNDLRNPMNWAKAIDATVEDESKKPTDQPPTEKSDSK